MIRKAGLFAFGLVFVFGASAQGAIPTVKLTAKAAAMIKALDKSPARTPDPSLTAKVNIVDDKPDFDSSKIKRTPAQDRRQKHNQKEPQSADLLSPEFKTFTTTLLDMKSPDDLEAFLAGYVNMKNEDFLKLRPDVQYAAARLGPMLAFRGFFWRMAPLANQSVMTQMMLLSMVRSFGENLMIFEPDTQWQAYMAFFGSPSVAQARNADAEQFANENALVNYFADKVAPLLQQSIVRLAAMPTQQTLNGRVSPVYFDNRIRFGKQAFKDDGTEAYDTVDRFARIGMAEKYMSMARFSRRISVIGQLASYNWNGNIEFRKELGTEMGINAKLDAVAGFDPFAVEGMTRRSRTEKARARSASGLFRKIPEKAARWMPIAYNTFADYAYYTELAWKEIEATYDSNTSPDFLLDPDLFEGRRDQISIAVANLRAMFPRQGEEARPVQGAISGEQIKVDMRAFMMNLPDNLATALMPYGFAGHEDIAGLKEIYRQRRQSLVTTDDIKAELGDHPGLSLAIVVPQGREDEAKERLRKMKSRAGRYLDAKRQQVGLRSARDYEFRNYLWGRAIKWHHEAFNFISVKNASGAWVPVGSDKPNKDLADREIPRVQRILAETRGGRAALNSLAIFVK